MTAKNTNQASGSAFSWRAVALAISILLLPALARGQGSETYVYPGTDFETEFTLGNINNLSVAVTALFYDGTTGESVAHALVLDPGAQMRFTPEDIGLDDFDGSTVITSDLPIATTASLFEGASNSFDHMAPVDSAVELILPLAGLGSAFSEVAIFNPGDQDAAARVIFVSEAGESISFNDRTIEPKRTVRVNVSVGPFVPETPAYVVIRTSNFFLGGRPVAAAAFIRNFNPPDDASVTRGDVAYIGGRPVLPEPSSSRLPLFLQGGGYMSIVQVINNTTGSQTIDLTAIDVDGAVIQGGNNPATIDLDRRASHTESVEDLFDISTAQLRQGSILIEGSGRLSAAVAIGPVSQGGIAILPADTALLQNFAYQTRQVGREFEWLIDLLNPATQTANVELTFVRDDATVVSTIDVTVPAQSQLLSTLAAVFPEAQGAGFVFVDSDTPILPAGVERRTDGTGWATRRALPAASDFMSGAPSELFAVGTVRSNGVGLPGVTVQLTGTQSDITLTDAAGTYLFDNLTSGSYTLTGQAIGYTIAPTQLNFAITTESSRDNDFDATLITPVITALSPSAAPVGSGEVTVSVDGGPFIVGSVAVLGTTELATTVVNSQRLTATIPATLLTSPLQLNFTVRNVGVAGNSVSSSPVTFTVGNAPPTLLGLSGQPDPLIAGSTGFTLTLSGAGFLPGITVFVDSVPRSALFISDTEITVDITTPELAAGGFLPIFVLNPGPAVPSNSLDLVVLNPPPDITAVTPDTGQVRLDPTLPPTPLTVTGTGFKDEATVLVDGTAVPTTFVNATTVVGSVPASLLSVSGVHDVQVSNPEPSVGPSFSFPITLTNPVPILTSIAGTPAYDPGQAGEDQPAPVLLLGSEFAVNSTAWVDLPCDSVGYLKLPNLTVPSGETLPPEYETRRLSPGIIAATVNLQCAGTYTFQVRSPQPGGGVSGPFMFVIP